MSLKHITLIVGLVGALGAGFAVGPASAQTPPQGPRPVTPQPADPAKPGSPPAPSGPTSPIPRIKVGPASSGAAKPKPYTEETKTPGTAAFIKNAGHDGQTQIDLAKLAQTHASRPDVKVYAQMLETDHQKATDELAAIAKSKNVAVPPDPTPAEKTTAAKLEGLQGAAFDRAYLAAMVEDHTKAIAAFTTATKNEDPDVKAFAEKTLPTLKHHLEEAQKLAKEAK